jgi:MFS family permease
MAFIMDISNPVNTKLNKPDASKVIVYLLVFLFTLHLTPATYISSSFLEQFAGSDKVGLIYTGASVLTLIAFILTRRILQKFGNYRTFFWVVVIELISLIILSTSLFVDIYQWSYIFMVAYAIGFMLRNIAFLNMDIFLEHVSNDEDTGGIRGIFLTALNTAFILGPLIAGLLITNATEAGKVYLLGAILLIPVLILTRKYFIDFNDSPYKKSDLWKTARKIKKNKNLYRVFATNFILRLFYAWMVIYTPLFLHDVIGFSLGTIGTLIGIALIPFIILEIPLGKIADKILGEKEIMTLGFVIAAFSTASMAFFSFNSFIFWAAVLFMTRVGASMIEVMTETYLFKKIDDGSVDIISFYRAIRPIAYIAGPLFASFILIFLELKFIFLVLGIILFYGIRYSLTLKDTL